MKRSLTVGVMAFASLLLFVANAGATSITQFIAPETTNRVSDDSYETLINPIGVTDTTVDIGDRLRGVFRIDQVSNSVFGTKNFSGDWDIEITAVFDVTIQNKAFDGTGYTWTFAPTATSLSGFSTAGTMIEIYEDASNDYNALLAGSLADAVSEASNGNLFWALGFLGEAGEFWTASAPTDDVSLLSVPGSGGVNVGTVNFWLNVTEYGVGPQLLRIRPGATLGSLVDVNGNGNFVGPDYDIEPDWADAKNDVNAYFTPVPEPTTLTLLGFGLLGAGFLASRKRSKRG